MYLTLILLIETSRCEALVPRTETSLSRQISTVTIALALALVTALGCFGWWAASRIDDRSIARETREIHRGLADVAADIPMEQDSSAIWDEAVLNLRINNEAWLAENLAEWMSEFYGHHRIYLLGPRDELVRAVAEGVKVGTEFYAADRIAIEPLARDLRVQMEAASGGYSDSTAAVTGLGVSDVVALPSGAAAIVSIRPIVPSTDAVAQRPGTEYLHVSLRLIDTALISEIAENYEISDLRFETTLERDLDRVSSPVLNGKGRILGFFSWLPDEPAYQLLQETAPVVGLVVAVGGLILLFLIKRLRRTSSMLEHSQAEASYLAFHDSLTGIPNRALFEDRLQQALANMRRTGAKIALHYLDIDRFKHVNDTLGHPAGDELIRQSAARLTSLVEEGDTVARLGGDEFAIVQFSVLDSSEAISLSNKIIRAFEEPFEIFGQELRVSASMGVVVSADADASREELARQADIALYEAKDSGRGRYQLFAGELGEAVQERRALETDLRHALRADLGLELVYQPIYQTRTGIPVGAEALIRWEHPTRGRLSPLSFIGLAEERGLIEPLGMWVLRHACAFAASSRIPWVAVNVSPVQFRDQRFADKVFAILAETGLAPRRLELEITEGLLLQNSPVVQSTLMRLRAKGIRVALDDFGTGYSSISYLRTHGIDKLKIDQSFTAQLGEDREIDSIVASIIDLGRAMHMSVTAEGVETAAQRTLLEDMGCNQLQGYLMSRPLTPERLEEIIRTWPEQSLEQAS